MKILIAEDDPDMQKILSLYLKKEGCEVSVVSNGEEAVDYLTKHTVDLILLDWMMPGKDGIQVCREIRQMRIPVKILMLTAKSENGHEYTGLSCGADDYLRKPFDMKVLLLRIKKLCRQEQILRCGSITLNQETFEVQNDGVKLALTKTEFELLRYFLINTGVNLTREQILDRVWGPEYDGDMRTVDTHVRRLRGKIGDGFIKTNIGLGYRMEHPHE